MGGTSGESSGVVEEAIPWSEAGGIFPPSARVIGRSMSQACNRVVLGVFCSEAGRVKEFNTGDEAPSRTTGADMCTKGPR